MFALRIVIVLYLKKYFYFQAYKKAFIVSSRLNQAKHLSLPVWRDLNSRSYLFIFLTRIFQLTFYLFVCRSTSANSLFPFCLKTRQTVSLGIFIHFFSSSSTTSAPRSFSRVKHRRFVQESPFQRLVNSTEWFFSPLVVCSYFFFLFFCSSFYIVEMENHSFTWLRICTSFLRLGYLSSWEYVRIYFISMPLYF